MNPEAEADSTIVLTTHVSEDISPSAGVVYTWCNAPPAVPEIVPPDQLNRVSPGAACETGIVASTKKRAHSGSLCAASMLNSQACKSETLTVPRAREHAQREAAGFDVRRRRSRALGFPRRFFPPGSRRRFRHTGAHAFGSRERRIDTGGLIRVMIRQSWDSAVHGSRFMSLGPCLGAQPLEPRTVFCF